MMIAGNISVSTSMISVYLSLVFVTAVWGGAFPAIAIALESLTPYEVLIYRHLLAILCFLPWMRRAQRSLRYRDVPTFLLVGFLMVPVYHIGLNMGELRVPPAVASFIVSLTPVLTSVLAHTFLKERRNFFSMAGLLMGLAGVATMVWEGEIRKDFSFLWTLWVFIALVSSAANTILAKRLLVKYDPMSFTTLSLGFGTAISLLLAPIIQPSFTIPEGIKVWTAVGFLGVVSNFLAYWLWFNALRHLEASQTVSFLYLVPLWGMLLSWVWTGEEITVWKLVGGSLVVSGVAMGTRAMNHGFGRRVTAWFSSLAPSGANAPKPPR